GSWDGKIYAFDAKTGAALWNFPTSRQAIHSSPTVLDGILYVGSDNNTLYAFHM
ncbi:MAG: PQQ-like beta-propeller repeat protein, partial [Chloroflexi bacterium]